MSFPFSFWSCHFRSVFIFALRGKALCPCVNTFTSPDAESCWCRTQMRSSKFPSISITFFVRIIQPHMLGSIFWIIGECFYWKSFIISREIFNVRSRSVSNLPNSPSLKLRKVQARVWVVIFYIKNKNHGVFTHVDWPCNDRGMNVITHSWRSNHLLLS